MPNSSRDYPINPKLKCGEEWITDYDDEDDDNSYHGPINFHVAVPTRHNGVNVRLDFNCRDKSSGVLLPTEPRVSSEVLAEEEGANDPFFFERGFYLEAKTGFQVWPGSRLMAEAFTCMESSERMKYWQGRLVNEDLAILELGAGIGFVGTCLAAVGGNVLLTDLPVLVEHGIRPNLKRNGKSSSDVTVPEHIADFFGPSCEEISSLEPVPIGCPIGEGWANSTALDWFKPVSDQLSDKISSSIDVIVACDCLFLRKLVDPFIATVSTLFQSSLKKSPKLLFTYQCRNMMGLFIGLEELLERFEQKGWKVECLAWRNIVVEGDGTSDLHLYEVSP